VFSCQWQAVYSATSSFITNKVVNLFVFDEVPFVAVLKRSGKDRRGRCYDFSNILTEKYWEFFAQSTAVFFK
jgi:hypothetical protein